MKSCTITVNDHIQSNYTYELTEPQGKNFDPQFKPHLTPQQMLKLGIFGGIYMRDCTDEFPREWFRHAKFAPPGIKKPDKKLNFFGVLASQPLSVWKEKGWMHPDDPRGWFQWYCRYYIGRRHPDDARQIKRWRQMARHTAQVAYHCRAKDESCRPRQRQALLHWAYDSRRL